MKRRSGGFTLLEALVALVIVAVVAIAAYTMVGRKLVDDGDPVRLAKENGYMEPKVQERHDFHAERHGCTVDDDVAFILSVNSPETVLPNGTTTTRGTIYVCCGAWFTGCHEAEK